MRRVDTRVAGKGIRTSELYCIDWEFLYPVPIRTDILLVSIPHDVYIYMMLLHYKNTLQEDGSCREACGTNGWKRRGGGGGRCKEEGGGVQVQLRGSSFTWAACSSVNISRTDLLGTQQQRPESPPTKTPPGTNEKVDQIQTGPLLPVQRALV